MRPFISRAICVKREEIKKDKRVCRLENNLLIINVERKTAKLSHFVLVVRDF